MRNQIITKKLTHLWPPSVAKDKAEKKSNVEKGQVQDDPENQEIQTEKRALPIVEDYDDIYFVGNGNEVTDAIGYDLALLAQSNHNIITRGTFGMWATLLCGGEYYGPYGPIVPGRLLDERQGPKKIKKKKRKN